MANSIFGKLPNQVPRNADLGQLAYMDIIQINQGFMHVREEQASGTHGGGSTAGFNSRTLNTVVTNTIPGATLGSNIVTLLPGTYYIEARAPQYNSINSKLSVYNNTDSVDLIVGTCGYANAANSLDWATGQITLTATKGIRLRHYTSATTATQGLGFATTSGQVEVYAVMKIWKVIA